MRISRTVELTTPPSHISRNDPCFCGSGKKYKKCHLLQQVNEPVFPQNKGGWISSLLNWSTAQTWYFPLFQKTFDSVFDKDKKEVTEEEMQSLSETILFEGKAKNNKTPLALYVAEGNLSSSKKGVYKAWLEKQQFGAWEVLEVFLGKGLRVKQWLGKEEFLVSEHLGSFSIQVGDVVIARLLPFENSWMFGGGVMAKLPDVWMYELKKHHMKFAISSTEFISVWHGKQPRVVQQTKSYEQLKKELFDFVLQNELPFSFEDFDKRLQKATNPTIFFYPMLICLYDHEQLMRQSSEIIISIWKASRTQKDFEDEIEPGSIENALTGDFMEYCMKRYEKEEIIHPSEQIKECRLWENKWLTIPQKALNYKTRKEAILEERKALGNKRTDFAIEATSIFWPKKWYDATRLHEQALKAFKKDQFLKSYDLLKTLVAQYPDFPFIYRSLANLGMTAVALGDKKEGIRLLKEALTVNPHYKFPKERLQVLENMSAKKVKDQAEVYVLKSTAEKLLKKIEKAQQRQPKRRKQWVKKK